MNEAIGQVLALGVAVAVSPLPIVAVVLLLATPRARGNGPAFLLGWLVGLGLVGTAVLLLSSAAAASDDGAPATWVSVLKLALGALLLGLAARQWRGRDTGGGTPKWMAAVDTFTPGKAFGVAVLLAAANPKNLLLTVGAAASIAQTGIDASAQAIALAVFVVIAALGVIVPVAIYFALGERSRTLLDQLRAWLVANSAAIMAVLLLVIGAKLVGDGLSGL